MKLTPSFLKRQQLLLTLCCAPLVASVASCRRDNDAASTPAATVTLYYSADEHVARPIIESSASTRQFVLSTATDGPFSTFPAAS